MKVENAVQVSENEMLKICLEKKKKAKNVLFMGENWKALYTVKLVIKRILALSSSPL